MTTTIVTIYNDTQDPSNPGLAYRRQSFETPECHPMDHMIGQDEEGPVDDLDDLAAALRGAEVTEDSEYTLDDLPTFGGDDPDDTSEVYSWDATRLLMADGQGGFIIEPR